MRTQEENKERIEYYYSKNRYIDFLLNTKTYRDIFWSKECLVSFIVSVLIMLLFYLMPLNIYDHEFSQKLSDLLGILIGSIVGLLGFVIGGLALIVGSIGKKMIDKISNENSITELLGIIFRFYYIGSILAFTVLIHILTYIILFYPYSFNVILTMCLFFLNSYLFIFSLVSSVMLMGSCIRLMILQYYFETN